MNLGLEEEGSKFVKEHNLDHVPLGTQYSLFVYGAFCSGFGTLFTLIACASEDWGTFKSTVTEEETTKSYSGYTGLYQCSRTFTFSTFLPENDEGIATTQQIFSQTDYGYIRCGGDSDLDCTFMLIAQLSIIVAIFLGVLSLNFLRKVMSRRWEGLVQTAKFAVVVNLTQMFFIVLTMLVWSFVNVSEFDGNSIGHPCGNRILESSELVELIGDDDNLSQSDITGLDNASAEIGESLSLAIVALVFQLLSSVLIWNGLVGYQLFEAEHNRMNRGATTSGPAREAPATAPRTRQRLAV